MFVSYPLEFFLRRWRPGPPDDDTLLERMEEDLEAFGLAAQSSEREANATIAESQCVWGEPPGKSPPDRPCREWQCDACRIAQMIRARGDIK